MSDMSESGLKGGQGRSEQEVLKSAQVLWLCLCVFFMFGLAWIGGAATVWITAGRIESGPVHVEPKFTLDATIRPEVNLKQEPSEFKFNPVVNVHESADPINIHIKEERKANPVKVLVQLERAPSGAVIMPMIETEVSVDENGRLIPPPKP